MDKIYLQASLKFLKLTMLLLLFMTVVAVGSRIAAESGGEDLLFNSIEGNLLNERVVYWLNERTNLSNSGDHDPQMKDHLLWMADAKSSTSRIEVLSEEKDLQEQVNDEAQNERLWTEDRKSHRMKRGKRRGYRKKPCACMRNNIDRTKKRLCACWRNRNKSLLKSLNKRPTKTKGAKMSEREKQVVSELKSRQLKSGHSTELKDHHSTKSDSQDLQGHHSIAYDDQIPLKSEKRPMLKEVQQLLKSGSRILSSKELRDEILDSAHKIAHEMNIFAGKSIFGSTEEGDHFCNGDGQCLLRLTMDGFRKGMTAKQQPYRRNQEAASHSKLQESLTENENDGRTSRILIGCLSGMCAVLVIVLTIILWRRRRSTKNKIVSDSKWTSELKEPTVYVSESSGTLPKRKVSEKSTCGQQEASAEPAVCLKADETHIPPSYESAVEPPAYQEVIYYENN